MRIKAECSTSWSGLSEIGFCPGTPDMNGGNMLTLEGTVRDLWQLSAAHGLAP
jgi:hypothetical protein